MSPQPLHIKRISGNPQRMEIVVKTPKGSFTRHLRLEGAVWWGTPIPSLGMKIQKSITIQRHGHEVVMPLAAWNNFLILQGFITSEVNLHAH